MDKQATDKENLEETLTVRVGKGLYDRLMALKARYAHARVPNSELYREAVRFFVECGEDLGLDTQTFRPKLDLQALLAMQEPGKSADNLVFISKLDVKLAAGGGGSGTERIERRYAFDRRWIREMLKANPAELRLVDVTGHSMEPTYCKGDIVLVDLSRRKIQHDHIYALRTPDGPIVKRLCKGEHGWHLHSDNPDLKKYPPQPVRLEDLDVIGEVVWVAGRRT